MNDAAVAILFVLGVAVVVVQLRDIGKAQLRALRETTKLAREREADEFNRFCYPHLYPYFHTDLRAHYWETRHIRTYPGKYSSAWFKAMKRWEGNSFETTAYRSLWEAIRTLEEVARKNTPLNDLEIEFLWQHRLTNSHVIAEDVLKDDHIPIQVAVQTFVKELPQELQKFRRRA